MYDSYRRPYRWTNQQQSYWQQRQQAYRSSGTTTRQISDNWSGFRRDRHSSSGSVVYRQQPDRQQGYTQRATRQAYQVQQRTERRAERSESRQQREQVRQDRQESREVDRSDNGRRHKRD